MRRDQSFLEHLDDVMTHLPESQNTKDARNKSFKVMLMFLRTAFQRYQQLIKRFQYRECVVGNSETQPNKENEESNQAIPVIKFCLVKIYYVISLKVSDFKLSDPKILLGK